MLCPPRPPPWTIALLAGIRRLEVAAGHARRGFEIYEVARHSILDADVAQEAANLVRGSIVSQTATALLAQANFELPRGLDYLT